MNPGVMVFPAIARRLVARPSQGSTSFSSPIATIMPARTAIADATGRWGSLVRIFAPVMSSSAGIAGDWANVASVTHSSKEDDIENFLNKPRNVIGLAFDSTQQ